MKALGFILGLVFLIQPAQASRLDTAVSLLREVAQSTNTTQLKGTTPEELVLSFMEVNGSELEEDETLQINIDDVYSSDESRYGTTTSDQFSSLIYGAMEYMDENTEDNNRYYPVEKQNKVNRAMSILEKENVIYSWNPWGDSVCGMNFTTVILIDPKTKKAYEFNFFDFSAGC